jgi:hypothetical protein
VQGSARHCNAVERAGSHFKSVYGAQFVERLPVAVGSSPVAPITTSGCKPLKASPSCKLSLAFSTPGGIVIGGWLFASRIDRIIASANATNPRIHFNAAGYTS